MKSAIVALLALAAGTVPARAETGADRAACTPDVWRLCASAIPNVGSIKVCLRQQRANLSSACRTVMDAADRPFETLASRR